MSIDGIIALLNYLIPKMPPDFLLYKIINYLLFKTPLVRFSVISAYSSYLIKSLYFKKRKIELNRNSSKQRHCGCPCSRWFKGLHLERLQYARCPAIFSLSIFTKPFWDGNLTQRNWGAKRLESLDQNNPDWKWGSWEPKAASWIWPSLTGFQIH